MDSLPIDILKIIEGFNIKYDPKKHTWDKLAENGNLKGLQFLHSKNIGGCTEQAMVSAAYNGHLDVVKWLHENRTEGCFKWAMDSAAMNGHIEVVKWLHENNLHDCNLNTPIINSAIKVARERDYNEVVKWVVKNIS